MLVKVIIIIVIIIKWLNQPKCLSCFTTDKIFIKNINVISGGLLL